MGSNVPNDVTMSTADEIEDSVEIKIKTLDSQTYTLRVNKFVPVPALKEQIATVTGVLSEQQRLICRGKVLRDDQLLSAYHVEDGHTLHLVSRQPIPSSPAPSATTVGSEGAAGHEAFNSASDSAQNRGSPVAHSFVFEAVNVDQGDRSSPTLGRFLSTLLSSIAAASAGTGNIRADFREIGSERPDRAYSNMGLSDATHPQPSSAAPRVELDTRQAAFRFPSTVNMGFQQPSVIPDSLTTIHQYLGHMRDEFRRDDFGGGELNDSVESSDAHVNEGENHSFQSRPVSTQGGLPTPASLAEIMLSARELLIEQAGGRLSQLARQLENQASVTDPLMRTNLQSSAVRSGLFLQNLGSLLLELGRTTMTLRMGQTPTEAVVNAGPAVFISASGPNPMMVQPVPFYPGSSFGGLQTGTANPGHGLEGQPLGSSYIPRNVDIRIHTGNTVPVATTNLGEQAGAQQTQEQVDSARNSPGVANFIRQTFSGASGSASVSVEPGVRVVPIRTVVAVPAGVGRSASDSSGRPTGLIYPLFARIQQHTVNLQDARGSQSSADPHSVGPDIDRHPILGSFLPVRDGSHLPTNPTPVVSGVSSTTSESAQYQGPSQVFISNQSVPTTNISSAGSHDGQQAGQGSLAQMLNRFDQWFRTVLTGGEVNASGNGGQDPATGSATNQNDTIRNSEAQESSIFGDDQAVFFSSLVRQLMPYISQGTDTVPGISPTIATPTAQSVESAAEPSSSRHRRDPPESPSSKRPKTN